MRARSRDTQTRKERKIFHIVLSHGRLSVCLAESRRREPQRYLHEHLDLTCAGLLFREPFCSSERFEEICDTGIFCVLKSIHH